MGLFSLLWFLLRVLPKPSRAAYPCQRVAFPIASGFVLWVAALLGSALAWRRARAPRVALWRAYLWSMAAGAGFAFVAAHVPAPKASAGPLPSHPSLGTGRGVFPGRVAWVHDPAACTWSGNSGYWWESQNTQQAVVDTMMSRAIRWLAGKPTDTEAWNALFKCFNQSHGRGNVGYTRGEKIAIKCNLNCSGTTWQNGQNVSPQMIKALLWQLTQAGVNQADITVGDPSRTIGQPILDVCRASFPNVKYIDSAGGSGRTQAQPDTTAGAAVYLGDSNVWSDGARYPATAFSAATYVIDFGVLRGHSLAGMTCCAKNWFGATWVNYNTSQSHHGFTPGGPDTMNSMHGYVAAYDFNAGGNWVFSQRAMGTYTPLVDLMGHKHLGGKTMLFLVDGLYASLHQSQADPMRWSSAPFNNGWTASLFASQDGVAIDSVCLDFLSAEPKYAGIVKGTVENYLHEAAQADHAPSGTLYDPERDGTKLTSLGVHEHWNNATDKQYSRNLGTGNGIELISATPILPPPRLSIALDAAECRVTVGDLTGDGDVVLRVSTNLTDWQPWQTNAILGSEVIFPLPLSSDPPTRFFRALRP